MSFQGQKIAHDLCRGIQKSSGRARLQEIFTGRSGSGGRLGFNREQVEYRWRIEATQFLIPLLLEQERERIAQMPDADDLPLTLDTETRDFVRATHEQITHFNALCVAPLLEHLPNAHRALDPYTEKWDLAPRSENENSDLKPLDAKVLTNIATQFQQHPAITFLLARPPQMQSLPTDQMELAVRSMEEQWRNVGAMHSARGYEDLLHKEPIQSPPRQNVGFSAALVSLRAALRVLDQLIYQAVLDDKPPILHDESVFAMKFSFHTTGTGADLQYQPNEMTGLAPQRGDIFYLKAIPGHGLDEDRLCEIVTVGFNFGQQIGIIEHPHLRVLDDNLCPFQSYWQRVFDIR